ncbi:MAG: hypothetical protein ABJG47_13020 [Ekhidna sp.]
MIFRYDREKLLKWTKDELIDKIQDLAKYELLFLQEEEEERLSISAYKFMAGCMIVRWFDIVNSKNPDKNTNGHPMFTKKELRSLAQNHSFSYNAIHRAYNRLLGDFRKENKNILDKHANFFLQRGFLMDNSAKNEEIFSTFLRR